MLARVEHTGSTVELTNIAKHDEAPGEAPPLQASRHGLNCLAFSLLDNDLHTCVNGTLFL